MVLSDDAQWRLFNGSLVGIRSCISHLTISKLNLDTDLLVWRQQHPLLVLETWCERIKEQQGDCGNDEHRPDFYDLNFHYWQHVTVTQVVLFDITDEARISAEFLQFSSLL